MLVLSRMRDQKIILIANEPIPAGKLVEISLVELRGDKARIGFDAPRELIAIHREEVWNAIQRSQAPAATDGSRAPAGTAESRSPAA